MSQYLSALGSPNRSKSVGFVGGARSTDLSTRTHSLPQIGAANTATTTTGGPKRSGATARTRTIPVIVHYIVRPHLQPCFSDVAIVPVEARVEEITLCAANTFFSYCDSYGAVLGILPSAITSDYGLFMMKPKHQTLKSIEVNRAATACADDLLEEVMDHEGTGADYHNGNRSESGLLQRNNSDPTFDTARRPTAAAHLLQQQAGVVTANDHEREGSAHPLFAHHDGSSNLFLPPIPPHPANHFEAYERSELDVLAHDYDECHGRAMMVRFVQTMAEKRSEDNGSVRGTLDNSSPSTVPFALADDDPAILAAKVKARVDALYKYNRNAAEDERAKELETEAVLAHTAIAAQLRPPEVYFCLNRFFLEREGTVADEEEERGALELIWESSWRKLLAYAELWKGRSLAAQQFREANASSRNHLQACEDKVRARLVAREQAEWDASFGNFKERFANLEYGMLAQYHKMRRLRAQHRSEIDRRLGGSPDEETK